MNGDSSNNQELLQEVQDLRRQLAAAQEAARAREETLRGELRRAEAEQRRLTKALKAAQTEHQRLSATFRAQAEELQAANEELATQAEELQVQSAELQIQNEELLNQNDQLQVQARLLEDQKQELESLAGKLEEERALLQAVLEQMPASVVIAAAPAGPIFLTNHRAAKLWPYPLDPFTELATFWRIRRYHPDGRPYRLKEMPLHRSLTMGEVVEDEEILLQPKNRGPVHLSVSSAPVRDTQGRIVAAIVTHFDITARKRAEAALARSQAELEAIFNSITDTVVFADPCRRIVRANPAFKSMFGYDPEQLFGQTTECLYAHTRDYEQQGRLRYHVGDQAESSHYEMAYRRRDGSVFLGETSGTRVTDARGQVLGFISIHRDITARKQAETDLRDREEELAAIYQHAPLIMLLLDEERRVRKLNRFAEQFTDAPAADLQGLRGGEALRCIHALDDPQGCGFGPHCGQCPVRRTVIATFETGRGHQQVEATLTFTINGKPQDVTVLLSTALFTVQGQPRVLVTIQDITARKQAEEALREIADRLRMAQQVAQIGTFELNLQSGVNMWTPELEAMYGLPPGGFGRTQPAWENLIHPEDRAEAIRRVEMAFETDAPMEGEWRVVWPDGSIHWLAGRWQVFKDGSGKPLRMTGINIDITARKQAEEALRQSEAQLQTILENLTEGLVVADLEGRLFHWNPAAVAMHGFASQEECQRDLPEFADVFELSTPEDGILPLDQWPLARILRGETLRNWEVHLRCRGADWQRVFSYGGTLARDQEGRPRLALVTVTDITARQAAEQEIRRLASFPRLNPHPVLEVDEEGRVIYANPAALKVAGELGLPEGVGAFLPPDLKEKFVAARQGGPREYVFDLALGEAVFAVTFHFPHDLPTARLYALDITERIRTEEALRESRKDLNRAQAVAHTGSWRLNLRRNQLFWSDETYRIFGTSPGTPLTYEAFLATVHPDDREYVDRQWTAALSGEPYDIEHRIIAGDTVKWLRERAELELDPQGELLSVFGTVQDITARHQAEADLRASEARERARAEELQAVLDAVPGIIFLAQDPECRMITGNSAAYDLLRMPTGSNLSKSAREEEPAGHFRVMQDGRELPSEEMPVQRAAAGETMRDFEVEVVFADGHSRHILGNAVPLWDEAGRPRGAVAAFMDITARQQAEAALRQAHGELEKRVRQRTADLRATVAQLQTEVMERQQAEAALKTERQRLLAVWEHIPAHVALLRPDYTFALVNGEFVRRFGDPESKRCYELLGQRHPCVECQAMAVFHTHTPVVWEWAGPDGNTYQVYDYPFTDVDGSPLVLEMGVNITQLKQAEQQAASLGRMYHMLSLVNETIVRAQDQETLFRQVCRIIMEAGDFLLAWVGLVDRETRLIKAATQFDLMDEYLQNLTIPLDDVPEGRGPTGTAVREGRYDICHDIAAEPRMAPWREQALARGFRSSAAFPLQVGAEIVGALTVYAGKPEFFTADEIALLESLADNLAFALDFMDEEAKRRQAEAALRESGERLRHLASQLLHAQERERHRLSLELHDDLGQSLMVLKMQIRGIEKMLTPAQWQIKQLCDQTLDYLTTVVDNVRRLSRDLRPAILEDLGLPVALKVLAEDFRKYYEVELSLDMDDIGDLFSREEEINIYRIFQECLTNIAKHARASQVGIAIKRQGDQVVFRVEDDGLGFDLASALTADPATRGLGLPSLEERVHMLDGALEIQSQADRGTAISFTVPLAAAD